MRKDIRTLDVKNEDTKVERGLKNKDRRKKKENRKQRNENKMKRTEEKT